MNKSVLLEGEKVDLCAPIESDYAEWASWFNNQEITTYLEQGVYPNSPEQQKRFYLSETQNGRVILLIKDKKALLLGVISLSSINYQKKTCEVAYVCPNRSDIAHYATIEALALVSKHAIERLGLERIYAGHAHPGLENWIKKTAILGFKLFSYDIGGFKHGITTLASVRTVLKKQDYVQLKKRRKGTLWPGEKKFIKIWRIYSDEETTLEQLVHSIDNLQAHQSNFIEAIESQFDA